VLTGSIFIRKNWADIAQDMQREHRHILSVVGVVMLLATAGVLVTLALRMDKAIESFIAEALSYGLFLAVPVWYAFRRRDGKRKAIIVYLLFLAVMLINDWLIKGGLQGELAASSRAASPRLLISMSMLLIWIVPLWMMRAHPVQARSIGLDFERAGYKILYGALGGGILISHLWVTLFYSASPFRTKPGLYFLFTFCYEVGAQSLSEEIFFRGFLFNYLYNVRRVRVQWAIILVSLLNVSIYLVKFRATGGLYELLGPAFYAFVMAMLNAILLRRLGGILPGLILNVLFSMASVLR